MTDTTNLNVGDKVYYQPPHYDENKYDNGIVKAIIAGNPSAVRVVYHCGGDWENYEKYTGALTDIKYLHKGWKFSKI